MAGGQHIYSAGQLFRFLSDLHLKGQDLEETMLVIRSSDPESDSLFGPYWVKNALIPVEGAPKPELEKQVIIEMGGI
jgi:hypothetical protein